MMGSAFRYRRRLIKRRRECGNDSQLPNDKAPIKQRRGLYAQLIERDKLLEHSAQHGKTGNEEGSVSTYTHGIAKHVQRKKISSTIIGPGGLEGR